MGKDNFIRASYDNKTRAVQLETDDGRFLVRTGGSLCWRTNNCGNLSSPVTNGQPSPKKTHNYVGFAQVQNPETHFFFIFPSYEAGREQLKASLVRRHSDNSIATMLQSYAPPTENNTDNYLAVIQQKTGFASSAKVGQLNATQLDALMDAIEHMEGYHNDKSSRKESWITASRFSTSNGAAPVPGAQVHIEYAGKTYTQHADVLGQLPPIVHPPKGVSPTKIKVIKPDGSWQTLVELAHGSKARTGVLALDMLIMSAYAFSHRAPSQAKDKKIPIEYRVKPGDSLSTIATKFKTTAEELKQVNGLKTDLIHPEQWLWIYAVGRSQRGQPKTASASKATVTAQANKARQAHAKAKAHPGDKDAQAKAAKSKDPSYLDQLATWVTELPVSYARSKDGEGAPLALFDPGDRRAPWMEVAVEEAKKWAGIKENEIQKTHNFQELVGRKGVSMVDTPWCASFVNYCLKAATPSYPMAHNVLGSFSIVDSKDRFVEISKPIYGAIRFSLRDGGGHVCFVLGKLGTSLVVLGGNQGDQIKIEIPESKTNTSQRFFVPIAYQKFAENELKKPLEEMDVAILKENFKGAVSPGLKASESQS